MYHIKTASAVLGLPAERARWVPLLPVIDALLAICMEASQNTFNLPVHADAADIQLGLKLILVILLILL